MVMMVPGVIQVTQVVVELNGKQSSLRYRPNVDNISGVIQEFLKTKGMSSADNIATEGEVATAWEGIPEPVKDGQVYVVNSPIPSGGVH